MSVCLLQRIMRPAGKTCSKANLLYRSEDYASVGQDPMGSFLLLLLREDPGSPTGHTVTAINSGLSLSHPGCSQPRTIDHLNPEDHWHVSSEGTSLQA